MASFKTLYVPQVGRGQVHESHTKMVCPTDSGEGKNSHFATKKNLYIASYNVRTLLSDQKLLELEEELQEIKWDIASVNPEGEEEIKLC